MKSLLPALFALCVAASPAPAQKPGASDAASSTKSNQPAVEATNPKTIKVRSYLENVLFNVTDKKGRMVNDLTKDDFRVFEDEKPQAIRFFSRETDLPLRIGILIDTSNSIRERLHFEQEAAIDFLSSTLRPGKDLAFVVGFDVEPEMVQDYTDDVGKLADAIRNLQAGGGTGLYDAVYFASKQKMLVFPPPEPYLRRVMIVVSDGQDNQSEHSRDEALAMAQRGEVTIYTISTNRSGNAQVGDKILRYFATETGGKAFFPFEAQDLAESFKEISRELRSQYSLGYVPTETQPGGTFRTIDIQVMEKGLRVRAKKGYFYPVQ